MADKIKYSGENLAAVAAQCTQLSNTLTEVSEMLQNVDTSDKWWITCGIRTNQGNLRETMRAGLKSMNALIQETQSTIQGIEKTCAIFDAAEAENVNRYAALGKKELGTKTGAKSLSQMISWWITSKPEIAIKNPIPNITGTIVKGTMDYFREIVDEAKERSEQRRKEYYQELEKRRENAYNQEVAQLYDMYKDKIEIGTETSEPGKAYYSPSDKHIYFNLKEDSTNVRGEGYTYYHEVGHMIDDYLVDAGDASSSEEFSSLLKKDFEDYVQKTMRENNCSRDEAYDIISDWLCEDGDRKNGLSDLIGGLTNRECEGNWFHSLDYWNQGTENGLPEKLNNEAFAHFFESSMYQDSTKVKYIKDVFPNAYDEFMKIVRNEIGSSASGTGASTGSR